MTAPSIASVTPSSGSGLGTGGFNFTLDDLDSSGDLLIDIVGNDGGDENIGIVDWTNIDNQNTESTLFFKIADGAEGASQNQTQASNENVSHIVIRIPAGEWTGDLNDVEVLFVAQDGDATIDHPGMTHSGGVADIRWILAFATGVGRTVSSYPSNMTENNTEEASGALGGDATSVIATAATSGTDTFDPATLTMSGNVTAGGAWLIAVPAPASGISQAIGIASETDSALALTHSKSKSIGIAVETDSAIAIATFVSDPYVLELTESGSTNQGSTLAFLSIDLGTTDPHKCNAIVIDFISLNGEAVTLQSALIANHSATIAVQGASANGISAFSAIIVARVEEGGSQFVDLVFDQEVSYLGYFCYRTIALKDLTPFDTGTSNANDPTSSLDIPYHGIVISGSTAIDDLAAAVVAWNNNLVTETLIEEGDSPSELFNRFNAASGKFPTIQTLNFVADWDTAVDQSVGVFASWAVAYGLDPAIETDSALPMTFSKSKEIGITQETDTALALQGAIIVEIGIATETDTALSLTFSKSKSIGIATETDTALSTTSQKLKSIGIASETDSSLSLTTTKSKSIGIASETDSALSVASTKVASIGIAAETDTALSLAHSKLKSVGIAAEIDSALTISPPGQQIVEIGIASEVDSAFSFSPAKSKELGQAFEQDLALALGVEKSQLLGIATEVDSAISFDWAKSRYIGLSTEVDSALPLSLFTAFVVGGRVVAFQSYNPGVKEMQTYSPGVKEMQSYNPGAQALQEI